MIYCGRRASLVAQMVKNLPAMQETQVWFLGREDPLEKEMATHSSILARRIPQAEEAGGIERVSHDLVTKPPSWLYKRISPKQNKTNAQKNNWYLFSSHSFPVNFLPYWNIKEYLWHFSPHHFLFLIPFLLPECVFSAWKHQRMKRWGWEST